MELINQNKVDPKRAKKEVPFGMAIENVKLMYECYPEHYRGGTVRLK